MRIPNIDQISHTMFLSIPSASKNPHIVKRIACVKLRFSNFIPIPLGLHRDTLRGYSGQECSPSVVRSASTVPPALPKWK